MLPARLTAGNRMNPMKESGAVSHMFYYKLMLPRRLLWQTFLTSASRALPLRGRASTAVQEQPGVWLLVLIRDPPERGGVRLTPGGPAGPCAQLISLQMTR